MKFKLAEIEVPEDEPFKYDALNRKDLVKFVGNLIEQLEGPFVLALDAPWGARARQQWSGCCGRG